MYVIFKILTKQYKLKYNKTQLIKHFMLSANSYMFRHQGVILREFNNKGSQIEQLVQLRKVKGKGHPCTGTEALYRPYSP